MSNKLTNEMKEIHSLLLECFPKGKFLSYMDPLEFVAHPRGNVYFVIGNCTSKIDVDCKVLEYFSRAAYKTEPYYSVSSNNKFHNYFLDGINQYFGTQFTKEDIEVIYTYLGNACYHSKTIDFISSGFDMSILNPKSDRTLSNLLHNKTNYEELEVVVDEPEMLRD